MYIEEFDKIERRGNEKSIHKSNLIFKSLNRNLRIIFFNSRKFKEKYSKHLNFKYFF